MSRKSLRAVTSIIIATGLFCAVILFGTVCFADKGEFKRSNPAIVSQISMLISTAESQSSMLNKSKAPANATGYFEPFWLLVLGATLLAIGTSIKLLIRAEAKASLPDSKSRRAL